MSTDQNFSEDTMASVYQGPIFSMLQRAKAVSRGSSFVVAVTSAQSKSGITYVSRMLAESLNRDAPGNAVVVDCRSLSSDPALALREMNGSHMRAERGSALMPSGGWRGNPEFRQAYLDRLRQQYAYVIVDCPSISESSDVLGLTGMVDGIVSIVEANRTSKSQIKYLERTIQQANGVLLGHVLNKRTYIIPEWIYSRMERMGL